MSIRDIRVTDKKILIPLIVFLLLLVLRMILPGIALKKTNQLLATFSPAIFMHVEDLDISLIRGAYRFENITGKIKSSDETFLKVKSLDVSVAWRELLHGKIKTDIVADKVDFLLLKDLKKLSTKKEERTKVQSKLFPLSIERIDIKDSSMSFEAYKSLADSSHLKASSINGRITNLTPTETVPLSFINLTANLIDPKSKFKIVGKIKKLKTPMEYDFDIELKEFDLTYLNPYLKRHMPLTFTKGQADLYSEVNSVGGKMQGYVKPFLKDIDVIANREKFISAKHLGVELVTALANLILDEKKSKTVATVIDFNYDKKLNVNTKKGIKKAIQHGFKQQISPGIEDRFDLH